MAKGSYQQLRGSGFDFEKLLGFAEDNATALHRRNERNKTNANLNDSGSVLSAAHGSNNSVASFADDKRNFDGALGQQRAEIRSTGRVAGNVYLSYITAGGSVYKIGLVAFLYFLCQILTTGGDYWISFWYKIVFNNIVPVHIYYGGLQTFSTRGPFFFLFFIFFLLYIFRVSHFINREN